jgi:uncharacterized membrane protein YuzA (DUF378 family)
MRRLSTIDWAAMVLLIIGGLNWLLVGLFQYNLVTALFGENVIARLIYVLVGLAALYELYLLAMPRRTRD